MLILINKLLLITLLGITTHNSDTDTVLYQTQILNIFPTQTETIKLFGFLSPFKSAVLVEIDSGNLDPSKGKIYRDLYSYRIELIDENNASESRALQVYSNFLVMGKVPLGKLDGENYKQIKRVRIHNDAIEFIDLVYDTSKIYFQFAEINYLSSVRTGITVAVNHHYGSDFSEHTDEYEWLWEICRTLKYENYAPH